MSKELEIIKELRCLVYSCQDSGFITNAEKHFLPLLDCLETALKNYEEMTNKSVILYGRTHGKEQALIDTICKNYKEVKITNLEDEKKVEALDIIKDKNINVRGIINSPTLEYYIDHCMPRHSEEPTQEEYDLLKEMLK